MYSEYMKKHIIYSSILVVICLLALSSKANAQTQTFNTNLAIGGRGSDVVALQTWLISNGYDIPVVSSGVVAKGYFGVQTQAAVERYQAANGIPSTGFFGPLTRQKINGNVSVVSGTTITTTNVTSTNMMVCPAGFVCTPNVGTGYTGSGYAGSGYTSGGYYSSPVTLLSPNGGEYLQKGSTQFITWSPANYGGTVKITLTRKVICTTQICPAIAFAPYTIQNGAPDNGTFVWNVGSALDYSGSNVIVPDGDYDVTVCRNSAYTTNSFTNLCDTSNATFKIYSSGTSSGQAPVINSVDAPTNLAVGQTGTWTVHASDSSGTYLSYAVDWGDTGTCNYPYVCTNSAIASTFFQNATFTHSYSVAGSYVVTFTVRNVNGQTAQTNAVVQVGASSSGQLRVVSPNGGESWIENSSQYITWTPSNYGGMVNITLNRNNVCTTQICSMIAYAPYVIKSNVPDTGSFAWNVGSIIDYSGVNSLAPAGSYTVQICRVNGSNTNYDATSCGSSSSVFNIYTSGGSSGVMPVITGIDAPTALSVGQTGTWVVHATDPNNGILSYSVDWGDSSSCVYPYACPLGNSASTVFNQTSTFTHSYSTVGTYTARFTVRNSSGQTAQTSATVQVSNSSAGPLRVISPNGGESWQIGSTHQIIWTSPYYFVASYVDLKLAPYYTPCPSATNPGPCPLYPYRAPYTIANHISANQNSYIWRVGDVLSSINTVSSLAQAPVGRYTVQLCTLDASGNSVGSCEAGDAPFSLF